MQAAEEIYVLTNEKGKYYVGSTRKFDARMLQHSRGMGSEWTKHHPMSFCILRRPKIDAFDEDNTVKKYMEEHGFANVRGGAYSQVVLTGPQLDFLLQEQRHRLRRCLECGGLGHFAKHCQT